jgi:hypothetical protein
MAGRLINNPFTRSHNPLGSWASPPGIKSNTPLTLGINKAPHWLEILSKIKEEMISWGGQWLTIVVKLILVKTFLSSLPIYQASFLLALKRSPSNSQN